MYDQNRQLVMLLPRIRYVGAAFGMLELHPVCSSRCNYMMQTMLMETSKIDSSLGATAQKPPQSPR